MEGVLLRLRARWIADGEKVTKYFCNLENRHYISKTMLKVKGQDDQDITDNKKIVIAVKDFYTNLFFFKLVEEGEICDLTRNIIKLNEESQGLEGEISYYETCVIKKKNMKNNKSPGNR